MKTLALLAAACWFLPLSEAQNVATDESSFMATWSHFESACLAGDIEQIEGMCDRRIVELLDGVPLVQRMGAGWKAEKIALQRKVFLASYEGEKAVAFVIVEITERGRAKPTSMVWVLRDDRWRCLNLPFENTLLPPAFKFPPIRFR